MANSSLAAMLGACPKPFLIGSDYPYTAGELSGRLCEPSALDRTIECCLPCPLSNSIYPSNFDSTILGAQWLGIPALVCTIGLLLSFAVLPVQRTSRHYLTICLVVAIMILELAYVIPLGTRPNQCHDAITPNNMRSDVSCAFSGAFILFGGFGGVIWVFIRSLSVHLQICWKYVPGDLFFYAAQIGGWGLTILFTILALVLSGVSYRLGSTCHINHANSIGTYWGPLLVLAGLSLILQIITFIYCIKVYLEVAIRPKAVASSNRSGTQATLSSGRSTIVKRATYRRVRQVIALQWRGMTVVVLVVITVCYLASVFLLLDQDISNAYEDPTSIYPWVLCMITHEDDKSACLDLTSAFVVKEQVVLPIPYLITACGIYCLLFLGRWGMVLGWLDLVKSCFRRKHQRSSSLTSFSQLSFRERLQATPQQLHLIKGDEGLSVARKSRTDDVELISPSSPAHSEPLYEEDDEDYFAAEDAPSYTNPPSSAMRPQHLASRSNSSNTHVSFNFSRPSTAQNTYSQTSPSFPRPALVSPSPNTHLRDHSQSSYSRAHRSTSNASERRLIYQPASISNTAPAVPPRSLSRISRNDSRNASRAENDLADPRPSHGMAWDPTASFANPMHASRASSESPVPGRTYAARGYFDAVYGEP